MAMLLDPNLHIVKDCAFVRFLRRRFPKHAKYLMTFMSLESGTWVVGYWVNRAAGEVAERYCWPLGTQPSKDAYDSIRVTLDRSRFANYLRIQTRKMAAKKKARLDRFNELRAMNFEQRRAPMQWVIDPVTGKPGYINVPHRTRGATIVVP